MRAIRNWRRSSHPADDLAIILVVGAIAVIFLIALSQVGVNGIKFNSYYANFLLYLSSFIVLIYVDIILVLLKSRPGKPIGFLKRYFAVAGHGRRTLGALPMIGALTIFMPVFSTMKSSILLFNDYSWDNTFIGLDRAIHGNDLWRLLQPVLGYPVVTSAISVAYQLWILLLYLGGVYFALYEQDKVLRQRYFISFFGIWIAGGVVLAITLASVGPCFVGPMLGIHVFDEQMAYLYRANQQFPVMVLDVQKELLEGYMGMNRGLGRGISAMPSMHVAQAFLFFLAMRHKPRWIATFFGAFALVILVGSVHLGYHYAVDGYVAIALTALVWALSGWLVAQRQSLRQNRRERPAAANPV